MSRKAIVLLVFVLLAGLSVPAHAEEAAQVGCGSVLDLGPAAPQAEVCPADAAANPIAEILLGGRTCRCSCGYPCKTDADCGRQLRRRLQLLLKPVVRSRLQDREVLSGVIELRLE